MDPAPWRWDRWDQVNPVCGSHSRHGLGDGAVGIASLNCWSRLAHLGIRRHGRHGALGGRGAAYAGPRGGSSIECVVAGVCAIPESKGAEVEAKSQDGPRI